MAKRLPFPTRSRARAPRRAFNAGTFIQRSRNESSEQKAIWHQVTGAGRSQVRREFFGLTEDEAERAKATLEGILDTRLKATGA